MDRDFYIYGYSKHSKDIYPNNRGEDFTIHLPHPLQLEGEWECGLVQFEYVTSSDTPYYVCCDIVNESYVGDYKLPVLRRVRTTGRKPSTQFNSVNYVSLKSHDFDSIRVYLRNWRNAPALRVRAGTHCTLHFRRIA